MRHSFLNLLLVIGTLSVPSLSRAAEAVGTNEALSRVMGESAIAVVRLDIEHLEPLTLVAALAAFPDLTGHLRSADDLRGFTARMREAGVRHVYLVMQPPTKPKIDGAAALCFVPATNETESRRIAGILQQAANPPNNQSWRFETTAGGVLAGPAGLVARAQAPAGVERPELSAALATFGDASLAAAVVPSADQRRVLSEMLPDLPSELGGSALRLLASNLTWAAVTYHPRHSLRVVGQATSAEAAQKSVASFDKLLEALEQVANLQSDTVAVASVLEELTPKAEGDRVVMAVDEKQIAKVEQILNQSLVVMKSSASRGLATNRLRQIALAMHNFISAVKDPQGRNRFPDAASRDAQGRPLLSWRVHVLPYLDQLALYREFHLDEPWDSEHNRKLISRMPDVYRIGSDKVTTEHKTCALLPIGETTMWPVGRGTEFKEITDGTSNTIMVVEAADDRAVVWTQPEDLKYDPANPAAGLGGHFDKEFLAVFADGSVHYLQLDIDADTLRHIFTAAGGEPVKLP